MFKTILFDLDGTLLAIDTEDFTKKYFKALSIKLKDYFTPEDLIQSVWASTKCMVTSLDPNMTNDEVFFEDFYKRVDGDTETLNPIFNEFYQKDFNRLKDGIEENKYIVKSVDLLKEKGYDLVVATNPLFPKIAILHRIRWAGLNPEDFKFITNFEDMHYCKPEINFYREILEKIDEEPSNCLMVGNDIDEDMKVKEIGMSTYLIEDYIIGNPADDKNVDYRGYYKDFYKFCQSLEDIAN